MFGKTEKELYEKEINELKRQNKKLMARCEIAEKYQNEYKAVSEQLKKIKKQYERSLNKSENLIREYEKYINNLSK